MIYSLEIAGLSGLTEEERLEVRGGSIAMVPVALQYAMFLSASFSAGFNFGYNVLGPAIFGK
ncbi:MAG: hypothetical protein LBG44_08105 [Gemmatimonadota bacterium]|jgi:hypothetical protein|nr:hypothetical protein [Gemmatimonadota bacterium]